MLALMAMLLCAFSANAQESVVAKIGNVEYTTFASAMDAADAATGNVTVEVYGAVEFIDGMELDGSYTAITFTGRSEEAKITIKQTAGGDYLTAHGKTVAFNDLILAKANPAWSGNSGHMGNYFSIQGGTVTYTDCTFPNGACTSTGTAVYNNCTFQNASEYGLWVYDDALVTVNGGTIDSTKGIKVYSEGEDSVTSTLTVQNATFTENVTAKPAIAIGYAESITLIGNTYNNTTGHVELDSGSDADCDGIAFVAEDSEGNDISSELTVVDRSNSSAACGVLVDGKIYTTVTTAAAEATSGSTVTLLYSTTETVELPEGVTLDTNDFTADNVTVATSGVAKIGSTTYATLAEAVAVAEAGDEIVLLGNVTEDVTLPAGVKFNGNGKAVDGEVWAAGNLTFVGHTKVAIFNAGYNKPVITIGEGACLEITSTNRMVIGHGAIFNITGNIENAKTADVAALTPSLIIPGASFTGAGVTFNVTNAYISAPSSYCSSSKSANGTFDFNFTNSIWESAGKLAFESQSTAATVNFDLANSVLNTGSHLVFGVSRGEVVIDNSNVNVGTTRQIENQSTMTIKNGSVVNGAVATSSNAKNPGTIIVENATYAVTGEFSGSDLGTGTLIVKKGATVSAGSITKANIQIDATGMAAGDEVNLTANLSNLEGSLTVVNNNLDASIVDGKIVLAVKPVAKIGDVEYATLEEAFGAATEGATITLLADATPALTSQSAITKAAVIDLGGNTLTLTEDDLYFGTTTFKNGTIVVDPSVSASTAVFWMFANQTLTFDNVDIIATGLTGTYLIGINNGTGSSVNLLNGSSITIDNSEKAELSTVIADNGNGNSVIIKDSKIDVKNVDARLYLGGQNGSVTIENSDIVLNGVKEGFYLRAGQTLAINGTSKVDITLNADTKPRYGINMTDATATYTKAETATVNATVYAPATGSNSLAYTKEENGYVRVWGEGGGNAKESYELKLYSGETLIATTKLNNVGNIIDGDVYVTWNFYYPQSNDDYWTTTWEEGHPNSAAQPTEVKLYIDGTLVATTAVKMSGADDVAPVVWRNLGGVAIANLLGEGTAENPYLIETLKDLKFFRDDVNAGNTYAGKTVKVINNINLNSEAWTPIATFNGVFDGNGKTISNLVVNGEGKSNQGFFGQTNNGEIKNLTINNATVKGRLNVGVVAGTPYTSKYTNIKVTGDVVVEGMAYVGGVGGKNAYANWTDVTVDVNAGSYVKATSTEYDPSSEYADENGNVAYRTYVGGVVGFNGEGGHTFKNISSNIKVIGDVMDIGGIFGIAHYGNKFENVTFSGSVEAAEGAKEVGGIAGVWNNTAGYTVTFTNCAVADGATVMIGTEDVTEKCAIVGGAYTPSNNTAANSGSLIIDGKEAWIMVAKVGEQGYPSLADALDAAAQAVETVTLIADVNENVTVTENVTIDGAGKKYTGTMTGNAGLTVTVQNVNFVNGGFVKSASGNTGIYTFKDCTFDGAGTYAYPLSFKGANTINVENCTVKDYLYSFLYVRSSTDNVNVKDVTVEKCPNYAVYFASGVTTATFEKLTVKNSNNGFIINNTANRAFTIKDCTMENVTTAINHSDGTSDITCTVLGVNDFGTAVLSEYAKLVGATVDGTNYYGSVQGMVEKAVTGQTVKLLSDIAMTEADCVAGADRKVLVDVAGKDITLDMNGKTISVVHEDEFTNDYIVAVVRVADGAGLTVTGEGTIDVKTLKDNPDIAYMFWKRGTTGHLTIKNGTYKMNDSADSMVYTNGNEIVTIEGGTWELEAYGTRGNREPWIFNVKGAGDNHVIVKGGTFNADINRQFWSNEVLVPETYYTVANADSTAFTVNEGAKAYVNEGMLTGPYFVRKNIGYPTFVDAVAGVDNNETITLLDDATLEAPVAIEKDSITIDLNGKKVTSTAKKAFEVYADATIKNGAIEAAQRCVDTRKAVELTLTDVTLIADEYTTHGNPQPLTIGGSENGTKVVMTNVNISAEDGYGIITFVETELTATNSTIGGYSALYVKPGSDNSEFNFVNSDLSGGNIGNDVEGNSFSTIAVRANNVAVNVDEESTVTANGDHYFAISFIGTSENTTTGSSVTVAGEITGNILDAPNDNTVKVKAEYADELAAAGYATIEAENGLVAAIKAVAKIGETAYATLAEAAAAAQAGDEIKLLADATFEGTLALPAGIKLTSNEHTINGSIRMLGDLELNGPLTITGGLWVGNGGETLTATLSGGKLTAKYFMFQHGTYTINADIDAVYGYLSFGGTFEVNSTIHTTGANGEVLYINGNVTLNDGAVLDSDNSVFVCNDNAVLTLKPGSKVDSNLKITTSGAKVNIDATGMTAGESANITGTVTNSANGTIAVVGNDKLEAQIVDGKIVLVAKVYVAQVGDAQFETLSEAFAAAQAGQTVTLLADVTLAENLTVEAGKEFTLDLNGKTVDVAWENEEDGKHIYALTNNGTLTVTGNGTINTRGIYNYGDMTLTSGTINAIDGNGGYGVLNYAGATFTMNGGTIATTLEDDNKVDKGGYDATPVRVDEGATFTMNGGVINNICDFTVAIDNYGTTIIKDGEATTVHTTLANHGTMTINGGEFTCNGIEGITAHALWAAAGETTINGGTFNGKDNYNGFNVDASEGAVVNITGGTFLAVHSGSLYGEGTITVSGGTFFDAVPADRCADGYVALPDLSGNYVVGAEPTATVNNLGMTTVAAGDYMVYGNGDNTADMPLSFVMQFLADQDAEDMTKSPFADWYGDFVITFTGIENGSFTADGCYLAGHYGSFGWVKVPVDGMTIENGVRYPVMLGVGMGQKYDYICSSVQDFKCALYLTPEILEANPNIEVKLELAVVDNSKGSDAAASALVNNDKVYSVAGYTYDAKDFVVDPNYIAEFTIDDAERVDYVNDTDKTVGTLTYKRTLAEGAWNPLYLPFQVDVAQLADNYDIAYYNQMLSSDSNNDGAFDSYIMEVAYITSGTLKANYPYFIRPKTSDDCYLEYVANDVTLCAAKETVIVTSSVANTFKLHGTHKTVSAADLAGCYTIKASGWVQTTIDLRPHRLYLEILENDNSPFVPAAAKSIRIVVRGEDGTTGVEEITGENGEEMIFDLQGRRVLEPEKGGMYIINGKKVIY